MRNITHLVFPATFVRQSEFSGPLASELNQILATAKDIDSTPIEEINLREAQSATQALMFPGRPLPTPARKAAPEAVVRASRAG